MAVDDSADDADDGEPSEVPTTAEARKMLRQLHNSLVAINNRCDALGSPKTLFYAVLSSEIIKIVFSAKYFAFNILFQRPGPQIFGFFLNSKLHLIEIFARFYDFQLARGYCIGILQLFNAIIGEVFIELIICLTFSNINMFI